MDSKDLHALFGTWVCAVIMISAGTAGADQASQSQAIERLKNEFPNVRTYRLGDQLTRLYGTPFGNGATPEATADTFRLKYADTFDVPPNDLLPHGPQADRPRTQQVMFDRNTGQYKFTLVYYSQYRAGIPVFRSDLRLLVRNAEGNPLVLAASSLRPLGDFLQNAPPPAVKPGVGRAQAVAAVPALNTFSPQRAVIYAGVDNEIQKPTLAVTFTAEGPGPEKWLFVADANTGRILYQENRLLDVDITGNVSGLATQGAGAEQCEPEASTPMPYAQVSVAGGNTAFTDVNGNFTIPNGGASTVTVQSPIRGQWFRVFNWPSGSPDTILSQSVSPPGPANFNHNAANTELTRAEVNGYIQSNVVRDFAIAANPSYPTLNQTEFPVYVNRTDGFCPGNAWYDSGLVSINFCQAGGTNPNTAWSSVIQHEYGHHLVNAGGSGQGQYGEGMGDVLSVVILDVPELGIGFFGGCTSAEALRTADNTMQYPCNGEIHFCGQLISGCVWDTRNELAVTNPSTYTQILRDLSINSILLHSGSTIDPSITIDFLTLDDNDGDLGNGTPHSTEINTGFGAHNMTGTPPPNPCPGTGGCCDPNGTVGCDEQLCCETICAADAFCCDTQWDQICADAAAANANCVCGGGGGGPANDACPDAEVICPGTVAGTTIGASTDGSASCGSSNTTPDVWYTYTPATSGSATASLCSGTGYDSVISAHAGCPGTSANQLACDDDFCAPGGASSVTFSVTGGQTYLIRVSGWSGSVGNFGLTVTGPACGSGCTVPADCDDGNPCTTDNCNAGTCTNTPNNLPCNDGDPCTTGDTCSNGSCTPGTPLDCNDGNACTTDFCVGGVCQNQNNNLPCNDGDPCTTGDICSGGTCSPGSPINCDDGNVCTTDFCVGGVCQHQSNNNPCNDGNLCTTGDTCSAGSCSGTPVNCDDGNQCTTDFCSSQTGACVNAPNSNPCNDGDPCTIGDTCSAGACEPGTPLDCNDGNICTNDVCVGGACQSTNNTFPCDDHDPCTVNDVCAGGVCAGTDLPICIPIDIRLTPVLTSSGNAVIDLSNPLDTEILIDPGDTVLIEVETANWDGDFDGSPRLRSIQVDLQTSSLTSGTSGTLSIVDIDADNNGICDAATELCPICPATPIRGVYIDQCRNRCDGPDGETCDPADVTTCGGNILSCVPPPSGTGFPDFYPQMPGGGVVSSAVNPVTLVTVVTMASGAGSINDGQTHYVSSYVLKASPDARGTFTLQHFADGDPDSDSGGSFARSAESTPILPINLGSARITIAEGSCCLADGTCAANVTRPECTTLGGFFRVGENCPPPDGDGSACICPANAACTEIRITPVLGTGAGTTIDVADPLDTEIVVDPGDIILAEIEVANWDTDLVGSPALRTIQVEMKTSSLTSGTAGSITVLDLDTDDDGTCDAPTELCPICAGSDLRGVYIDTCRHRCGGTGGAPCDPGDVNTCNGDIFECLLPPVGNGFADFFPELPGSGIVVNTSNPNTLIALVTMSSNTGAIDDAQAHYVASYVLSVGLDARGTFTFEQFVDGDPASNNGGSFARDSTSVPILPISLGQLRVTIAEGSCCFPDQSCTPNVTRPECTTLGGFFRPGAQCPPPQGNGPDCGCLSDADCDDLQLCTIEFCDANLTCSAKDVIFFGDINNDAFASADDVNCLLDDVSGNFNTLACCDRALGACTGPADALPPANFQKKDLAPCQGCPQTSVNPDTYNCDIDCSLTPCAAGQSCVTLGTGAQVCRDPNNMGDGFISADDVNAVLDVIAGTAPNDLVRQPCLDCGGVPAAAPEYRWDLTVAPVGNAALFLKPSQRDIRPGSTIALDVFIDAVTDLRTFQVAIEVTGGKAGQLQVVSAAMDTTRTDWVFAGRTPVTTTSASRALLLGTLASGGVAVPERGYLGTFVLRASPDAAGSFAITLRDDGNTLLRTSSSEVIAVSQPSDATSIVVTAPTRPNR